MNSRCMTRYIEVGRSRWVWCMCLPELRLATSGDSDEAEQLAHLHRVRAALDAATAAHREGEVLVP